MRRRANQPSAPTTFILTQTLRQKGEIKMSNDAQNKREPIEILLVSDANYSAFLATTIVSILSNAAPDDRLRFHIVDGGMTQDDLDKIKELAQARQFEVEFYRPVLQSHCKAFRDDVKTFPVVVNYRLFLAKYLPSTLDKVLYMDVDVVALKSLRELWDVPLDDLFVGAIPDRNMRLSHRRDLGLPDDYPYFNSGVLLVNLKKWRDEAILEKLLEIANEIRQAIDFPDQDVLNVYAYRNGYKELDARWNSHPRNYDAKTSGILHYMGSRHRCPHLDLLYGYAAQTPYGKLPMQGTGYKLKRGLKRIGYNFLCFFLFRRKWRREFRKHFNLR